MYFKLFPNCILTKGYGKSVIVDLHRFTYTIIENDLVVLLNRMKTINLEKFKEKNNEEIFDQLLKILNDLRDKELGFFTNIPNQFPAINLIWDAPAFITNAVIEVKSNISSLISEILVQLSSLQCRDIQIRCNDKLDLLKFSEVLNVTENSKIKNIEIIFKYSTDYNENMILSFLEKNFRINRTLIYSSPENKNIENVFFTTLTLSELSFCGETSNDSFTPNIYIFSESQQHNTCLNRKICIDVNGEIKNCLSMTKSYGNIKDTTLIEAMEKQGFKDLWFINKDKIDVCKDCEFRHMCTDCRALIKDSNNIYSQPAKCTYNPYIAKWEIEESYIPVEECGTYSKEAGFIVNKRKVNKQIWGE